MNYVRCINIFTMIVLVTVIFTLTGCGSKGDSSNNNTPTANSDTTPPAVASVSPQSGVSGVAVNLKAITATFNEAMDAIPITTSTFTLKDSSNQPVTGTVTYSGKTATFTPAQNLAYLTTYTAAIDDVVKDVAGNKMEAAHTWSFTTGSTTAESNSGEEFSIKTPNPLTVNLKKDIEHDQSRYLYNHNNEVALGGDGNHTPFTAGDIIIETEGEDGTKYKLTIPEDALALRNEKITLTPVSGIEGFSFTGGLLAAVHIEPDGLTLLTPATLTIEPNASVPVTEQIGFSYKGEGEELHMYPMDIQSGISFKLTHFSGYGVGVGTSADISRLRTHSPTMTEDQFNQMAAEILKTARDKWYLEGKDYPWQEKMRPLVKTYFNTVIKPLIMILETTEDLETFCNGIRKIWKFHGEITLMDIEDSVPDIIGSVRDLLQKRWKFFFDDAYGRCVNQHILGALREMMELANFVSLMGVKYDNEENEYVLSKALSCLKFELEFESIIEELGAEGEVQSYWHVKTKVPIEITEDFRFLQGSGKLEGVGSSLYDELQGDECITNWIMADKGEDAIVDTLEVYGLQFEWDREDSETNACTTQKPVDLTLIYEMAYPVLAAVHPPFREDSEDICNLFEGYDYNGLNIELVYEDFGSFYHLNLHGPEESPLFDMGSKRWSWEEFGPQYNYQWADMFMTDWDMISHGGALIARKTFERTDLDIVWPHEVLQGDEPSIKERTTFSLFHRP